MCFCTALPRSALSADWQAVVRRLRLRPSAPRSRRQDPRRHRPGKMPWPASSGSLMSTSHAAPLQSRPSGIRQPTPCRAKWSDMKVSLIPSRRASPARQRRGLFTQANFAWQPSLAVLFARPETPSASAPTMRTALPRPSLPVPFQTPQGGPKNRGTVQRHFSPHAVRSALGSQITAFYYPRTRDETLFVIQNRFYGTPPKQSNIQYELAK